MILPSITVVVPAYNASSTIERCICSLLAQGIGEIEILLIDDGSTDDTLAICEAFARRDSRVKVFSKKNEGQGIARNYGLSLASGDYVAFVDSDDECSPDMYSTLLSEALDKSADIVFAGYADYLGRDRVAQHPALEFVLKDSLSISHYMADLVAVPGQDSGIGCIGVWDGIYRRSVLLNGRVLFPSERTVYSEDLVFKLRALRCAECVCSISRSLYRYHLSSESFSKKTERAVLDRLKGLYNLLSSEFDSCLRQYGLDERNKNRLFISLRFALRGVTFGSEGADFVCSLARDDVLFDCLEGYSPTTIANKLFYLALKTRSKIVIYALLACLRLKG